jgi:hypothetical protein
MKLQIRLWHVVCLQILFIASLVWAADSRITELTELTDGNVAAGDFVECVDVSDTTDNAAGSSRKCQIKSIETAVHAAGSATAGSWPVFGSGTLLTTAEDGALEQDGDAFYLTTDAGNRGAVAVRHCIRADSTRTFTSNTSQQAIFTTPTNGRLTLETGTYLFDGIIAMTGMSATSGNGKFSVNSGGTATLGAILWRANGQDVAAESAAAAQGGGWHVIATQTAADVVTAATNTALAFTVEGTFEVTGAGTIVPSFAQTTAAAAVVSVGSYLCFNRIGSTTMTSVGQWD